MKIDNERRAVASPQQPRTEFKEALKNVASQILDPRQGVARKFSAPVALASGMVFTQSRAHSNKVAEDRTTARATMDAKVEKAHEVRSDGMSSGEKKVEAKVLDLIARELKEERAEPAPAQMEMKAQVIQFQKPHSAAEAGGAQQAQPASAQNILQLVERIRIFEKAGRPAMAISVGGNFNADVEIERAGPKLVALKIVGRGKTPSAAGLDELRAELLKNGIKVSALAISVR